MTSAECVHHQQDHHGMEFVHTLSKKTRSNQSLEESLQKIEQSNQHLQPQPNTPRTTISKRHSLSSILFRGKQPLSRIEETNSKIEKKIEEKKGYFERRKERKLKKIEQKPVYKWNYKSLYKWLKYKGFDKKYIKLLKKDRLNGYIMLTLEISDLVSLDIPSDIARRILNTLIETSDKQDHLVEANCECGEVELPLQPVRSTMVLVPHSND